MSVNPLQAKVAVPYARALFDFSVEQNIMHQITADFQNLDIFLNKEKSILMDYLTNPVVTKEDKHKILTKILKPQINGETFKFLIILINRDRINLLLVIINNYLKLVYETAAIKVIEVLTASAFTNVQEEMLIEKLKKLTNSREIRLMVTINSDLIGGFLIKTESKILDFTVKNQLQQLAKHLDTILEI